MDLYITLKIFENLDHDDKLKIDKIITCFGSLFENIYTLIIQSHILQPELDTFSDSDICRYINLTSLDCMSCLKITDIGIKKLKSLTHLNC